MRVRAGRTRLGGRARHHDDEARRVGEVRLGRLPRRRMNMESIGTVGARVGW